MRDASCDDVERRSLWHGLMCASVSAPYRSLDPRWLPEMPEAPEKLGIAVI